MNLFLTQNVERCACKKLNQQTETKEEKSMKSENKSRMVRYLELSRTYWLILKSHALVHGVMFFSWIVQLVFVTQKGTALSGSTTMKEQTKIENSFLAEIPGHNKQLRGQFSRRPTMFAEQSLFAVSVSSDQKTHPKRCTFREVYMSLVLGKKIDK